MMSGCAPSSGQRSGPPAGAAGFRLVLGQPEQVGGRTVATTAVDEALKGCLAADLDGTFEQLVRAYQDRLYSFALRLTGRREDAEEVAQDAFVRAYRALSTYPRERIEQLALRAWLYQITLNVARNRFRGGKLKLVSLDHPISPRGETAFEAADAEDARPDARYEVTRRRADMATLVAGLPERYRAPILLRYVEGLRLEEVARVLGQPVGTAKSNVHRGVNALRQALVASRREGVRR
jgi:RNA polymerase sigma-70 factor, ECF subfamily